MGLVLFGFPRCGKSYFGSRLATMLALPFVDLDRRMEQLDRRDLSNREIYLDLGEKGFRELERRAILSLSVGSVVAVGAGAILQPGHADLLSCVGKLVYLELKKELLKRRAFTGMLPIVLDPTDPEGSFERLYAERLPRYEAIVAKRVQIEDDQQVLDELARIARGH